MSDLGLASQLLLGFGLAAMVALLVHGLSILEVKIFGTQRLKSLLSKRREPNKRSGIKVYLILLVILLLPFFYKYGCGSQCKSSISEFFGKSKP